MSAITTHILDTARGKPAAGVLVTLEIQLLEGDWQTIGQGRTNANGRLPDLLPEEYLLTSGSYRLTFAVAAYFQTLQAQTFYPSVQILFTIHDVTQHYHVPLLLSPFGYSTYRGS